MAYGLPKQLSGAVGRTKHNKKPLGSDFFGCWSRVVFANTAISPLASAEETVATRCPPGTPRYWNAEKIYEDMYDILKKLSETHFVGNKWKFDKARHWAFYSPAGVVF